MPALAGPRTGVAAILGGLLIFAGQAGELAFGPASDAQNAVWATLIGLGIAALVVAILGLRPLVGTRLGRVGWRVCVAGVVLLGLFGVQALVTVVVTGDVPGNFVLFGLGFLLLFVGQIMLARGLRDALGPAWVLPLVGAVGIIVAIVLDVDPVHDIGLFVFEGAWVALGVALLRRHAPLPRTQSLVTG